MSRGAGWVERRLRKHFDDECLVFWPIKTERLCRTVYETPEVTAAQRGAVLRVLRRLRRTGWHGNWRLCKYRNSHDWFLEGTDAEESPPPFENATSAPAPATSVLHRKLVGLLGMMGSEHGGERANAAALADRMLRDAGLTWHDVVSVPPKAG